MVQFLNIEQCKYLRRNDDFMIQIDKVTSINNSNFILSNKRLLFNYQTCHMKLLLLLRRLCICAIDDVDNYLPLFTQSFINTITTIKSA